MDCFVVRQHQICHEQRQRISECRFASCPFEEQSCSYYLSYQASQCDDKRVAWETKFSHYCCMSPASMCDTQCERWCDRVHSELSVRDYEVYEKRVAGGVLA